MNTYNVSIGPSLKPINPQVLPLLKSQLSKDLFIAARAYDVEVYELSFQKDKLFIKAYGAFESLNQCITFLILRLSEKVQQVLFRSYELLKSCPK